MQLFSSAANFRSCDGWRIRLWHSRVHKLPFSRCVMKMATLHLLQCSKTEQDDDDAFLIAKEAFDGEDEEVFAEAALQCLKKCNFRPSCQGQLVNCPDFSLSWT